MIGESISQCRARETWIKARTYVVRKASNCLQASVRTLKAFVLVGALAGQSFPDTGITVTTSIQLQQLFAAPVDSIDVLLQPGVYHLTPSMIVDSSCGNCESPQTRVNATVGLHLRGRFVRIRGVQDNSVIIYTHAGYGLFFDQCAQAVVENITITGGERDTNGNATDAGIVAKNSTVTIRDVIIRDNIGDSATVARTIVGIMGICGRENSRLTIVNTQIIRNSWDGIALYRDASAHIEGNIVDGVDKARGAQIGGGRGVGIGLTWNGTATIRNNLVTRYWKGVGLFVDAHGTVEGNIIEDILTWGIAYWDAGKGLPVGFIRNNIVYKTGACGASITRANEGERTGEFTGNIIVQTGQNPKYDAPDYYCYQCALALHAVPKSFIIKDNLFSNNRRATPDLPDYDLPREAFVKALSESAKRWTASPVFRSSLFVKDFLK